MAKMQCLGTFFFSVGSGGHIRVSRRSGWDSRRVAPKHLCNCQAWPQYRYVDAMPKTDSEMPLHLG